MRENKVAACLLFAFEHRQERTAVHAFHRLDVERVEQGRGEIDAGDHVPGLVRVRLDDAGPADDPRRARSSAARRSSWRTARQCHGRTLASRSLSHASPLGPTRRACGAPRRRPDVRNCNTEQSSLADLRQVGQEARHDDFIRLVNPRRRRVIAAPSSIGSSCRFRLAGAVASAFSLPAFASLRACRYHVFAVGPEHDCQTGGAGRAC